MTSLVPSASNFLSKDMYTRIPLLPIGYMKLFECHLNRKFYVHIQNEKHIFMVSIQLILIPSISLKR